MDRVRLGRALGYGTRHAARTVAAVVEAATAPGPEIPQSPRPSTPGQAEARPATPSAAPSRGDSATKPLRAADVGRGVQHLRRSIWQPLAVFSGALWLRVTGLFFGLIAFTVGAGAWRVRGGWQQGFATPESSRFWLFAGVAGVFAYFAVSSFVRANLKERRAAGSR